jgi:hypothetical protein
MEDVGVLQHHLVYFLMQSHTSCVLVIIVSNRVEFLLEGINKGHPSGSCLECHRCVFVMYFIVKIPPIFDMGNGFNKRESDIFGVGKTLNRVIPI